MRHVVVFQFNEESIDSFDHLVALEEDLAERVDEVGDLDGHDMGVGEVNIFFFSDKPQLVFAEARSFLEREGLLAAVRVACRPVDEDKYTWLWPISSSVPFRVA